MAGKTVRRDKPSPDKRVSAGKAKRTVVISAEADQRLALFCIAKKRRVGEVIETLINTHLRGFVLQERGDTEGWNKEGEGSKIKLA
jgi:hypothetical protein